MSPTAPDWSALLADQIDWHWTNQARPRLDGLTDPEYLWEPVPGSWNIRPRGEGVADEVGAGDAVIDFAFPEPQPPPVTTIAWRLGHINVGILGQRNARYFNGPATEYDSYQYTMSAQAALDELDANYARWISGVRGLSPAVLTGPCEEAGFEQSSMAELVLHIHRELIHHLAEIALLRDLYRSRTEQG
jgi:DinB superfamily